MHFDGVCAIMSPLHLIRRESYHSYGVEWSVYDHFHF